jgi:hypothetical protein
MWQRRVLLWLVTCAQLPFLLGEHKQVLQPVAVLVVIGDKAYGAGSKVGAAADASFSEPADGGWWRCRKQL